MTCSSTTSVPLGHGHQLFARVSPSQQSADTVITLCGDVIPRATTLYYCVRMPERQPASRAVAKLAWCCLLAGVLTSRADVPARRWNRAVVQPRIVAHGSAQLLEVNPTGYWRGFGFSGIKRLIDHTLIADGQ